MAYICNVCSMARAAQCHGLVQTRATPCFHSSGPRARSWPYYWALCRTAPPGYRPECPGHTGPLTGPRPRHSAGGRGILPCLCMPCLCIPPPPPLCAPPQYRDPANTVVLRTAVVVVKNVTGRGCGRIGEGHCTRSHCWPFRKGQGVLVPRPVGLAAYSLQSLSDYGGGWVWGRRVEGDGSAGPRHFCP